MPRDDCRTFEEAIASERPLDEELQQHARICSRCRALAEVMALPAPPIGGMELDQFAKNLLAAAADAARRRSARWERRRRIGPLVIGLVGYLAAASSLLVAFLAKGTGSPTILLPPEVSLPALPAPDPNTIAAVLIGSAVWLTALAIFGRRRATATPYVSG